MPTSVSEYGRELIAEWNAMDRSLVDWVLKLADFDDSCYWMDDGFASCAAWLSDQCAMSRSDSFEKLKVSHELRRRVALRTAFVAGTSYSTIRTLVRLVGVDDERDAEFLACAKSDSVRLLEQRVKNWNYFNDQDKKPTNLDDRYGIRRSRGFGGGLGRAEIQAPDDMLDRFFALIDAYGDWLFNNTGQTNVLRMPPVDESTQWTDDEGAGPSASDTAQWTADGASRSSAAKRLDYLFDLLEEVALTASDKVDPYNAAVGITIQLEDLISKAGPGLSTQESSLTPEAIERLLCDAGVARILIRGTSEIIDLGREERLFNRKQRRAIRFRHGHVCAVRGCGRRITHIHHVKWWDNDGETNIDNGVPLCSYHHHLVHEGGWTVDWNPTTGITRLVGPLGQILETEARFGRLVA